MTKCDFCTEYIPEDKECYWISQAYRRDYCKKAIENMVKAFGNKHKNINESRDK